MMGRWLKRGGVLLVAWVFASAPLRADLRSFKVPPNVLHMYEKGDVPDPFPWGIVGPIAPGTDHLNPDGDEHGDGWPSFTINGVTFEAECTFSINENGEREIGFSETINGVWSPITVLTSTTGSDEEDPAITTNSQGGSRIVYWRNNPVAEVWMIERAAPGQPWGTPHKVSTGLDPAQYPSVAEAFGKVHVGYEVSHANGTKDIVVAGRPDAQPNAAFQPEVIAHTLYGGTAYVEVESNATKLWVSWVASDGTVGWTNWQNGSWAPVQMQSYSGPDGIEAARNAIRREVKGTQ